MRKSSVDTPGWFQMTVFLAAVARQQLDRQGTRELWQRGECCVTSMDIQTAVRFDREISLPLMLGWASHGSYDMQAANHSLPMHPWNIALHPER